MSDYDTRGYTDLPLFARADFPATSHQAAEYVAGKVERLRAEFVRCLREIGEPATAQEISARANAAIRESVRKRAAECVTAGAVTAIGTKRCSVTNHSATVYWFDD